MWRKSEYIYVTNFVFLTMFRSFSAHQPTAKDIHTPTHRLFFARFVANIAGFGPMASHKYLVLQTFTNPCFAGTLSTGSNGDPTISILPDHAFVPVLVTPANVDFNNVSNRTIQHISATNRKRTWQRM